MVQPMASPWGAIVLAAGVTAASTFASAQPIVLPSEVPDPAASAKPAEPAKPAAAVTKTAKPAATKPATTKTAKPAPAPPKPAKSTAAKSAKSTRSTKPASAAKPAPRSALPAKSSARVATAASHGGRGDNMPRGFTWPATRDMQAAGKACEADLDALGVTWQHATPEGRIVDPIEVPDGKLGGIQYTSKWRSPPYKLD